MTNEPLSFAALEQCISKMPDGPSAALNTPRWLIALNALGTAGIIVGTLPFLMIQVLTPQQWMVGMARIGLWAALLGYAPFFARTVWVLGREFWHWQPKLVEQSDHDLAQFRELRHWLRKFPRADLEDHHRFARLSQERLHAKLGLLQGGFDRLGVLPALLALLVLLRNAGDMSIEALLETPYWQSGLALIIRRHLFHRPTGRAHAPSPPALRGSAGRCARPEKNGVRDRYEVSGKRSRFEIF